MFVFALIRLSLKKKHCCPAGVNKVRGAARSTAAPAASPQGEGFKRRPAADEGRGRARRRNQNVWIGVRLRGVLARQA